MGSKQILMLQIIVNIFKGFVERLWINKVLPVVCRFLNILSLNKKLYFDRFDELMTSLKRHQNQGKLKTA